MSFTWWTKSTAVFPEQRHFRRPQPGLQRGFRVSCLAPKPSHPLPSTPGLQHRRQSKTQGYRANLARFGRGRLVTGKAGKVSHKFVYSVNSCDESNKTNEWMDGWLLDHMYGVWVGTYRRMYGWTHTNEWWSVPSLGLILGNAFRLAWPGDRRKRRYAVKTGSSRGIIPFSSRGALPALTGSSVLVGRCILPAFRSSGSPTRIIVMDR